MISLGFDESYTRIGVSIVKGNNSKDAKILYYNSFDYNGCKNKSEKRRFVKRLTKKILAVYNPDVIIVERIRTFSQNFLSIPYIKTTGALIATIVDTAYPRKVYSADTRSWKSRICGNASGMHKADKGVSVRYIIKRFNLTLNDDAADAICIALYGLDFEKNKRLLKVEE